MRLDTTMTSGFLAVAAIAAVAGCQQGPGTSVRVALGYDDAIGLDTADVTLNERTESGPISHELLLLVPDDRAGAEMPIAVWGRKAGMRAAYGTATAVPVRGKTVEIELSLTACTPGCQSDVLTTCTGPAVTCAMGCSDEGDAHCLVGAPSNGVDPSAADALTGMTMISADALFNTDSGAITGGLTRAAGTGVISGIGYLQAPAFGPGGAPLGIFVFHDLAVQGGVTVRFTGARAAVLFAGNTIAIGGVIDATAGHAGRSSPGPGGGAGGSAAGPAGGCGPGVPGGKNGSRDGGGGGGGGGQEGGPGGTGGSATPSLTGVGGPECLPALLEPLQGGSGGGRGGAGTGTTPTSGGGGGGALQISALKTLVITGTINAGGAGADGGSGSASDGGGGCGGGGGGAILLEASTLTIAGTAIIAANGGGGGGGSAPSGSGADQPGLPGDNAAANNQPVDGGSSPDSMGTGGTGGATGSPPDVGRDGVTNGGGGGGGVGRIVLRGNKRIISGTISPPPMQAELKPPQ